MRQVGITFLATCTPFDVVSPPIWQAFKKLVMESAKQYGLTVAVSEHPSIDQAQQEFWRQQRISIEAAERLAKGNASGG